MKITKWGILKIFVVCFISWMILFLLQALAMPSLVRLIVRVVGFSLACFAMTCARALREITDIELRQMENKNFINEDILI